MNETAPKVVTPTITVKVGGTPTILTGNDLLEWLEEQDRLERDRQDEINFARNGF
jgi:hypothetical protein